MSLITRQCAFGFDTAAKAIGEIVGYKLAHTMALDADAPGGNSSWYLNRATSLLAAFDVISATGYLPTAREAMSAACEAELERIAPTFHQGGRA